MSTLSTNGIEHPFYAKFKKKYKMIRDVLEGKDAIDAAGETYLIRPHLYTEGRFKAYQARAVFYNATARTLEGYQGALYRKEAKLELTPRMEYLRHDADGEGNTFTQFSKSIARDVIPQGRAGLLVEFPSADGIETLEDERNNNIQGHFAGFSPEAIVDWSTRRVGAKTIISYVLLEEGLIDGITREDLRHEDRRLLELSLDEDGFYIQKNYGLVTLTDVKGNEYQEFQSHEDIIKPTKAGGERLDYIPFVFIGSETFTPKPDTPPFYDLAQLNISHYRNSADWEQAVFMIGQPTMYITGVDSTFIEENRGHMVIGSAAILLLPEGAAMGMVEPMAPRPIIKQAMDSKEQQMIGLGARIIQDSTSRGSEAAEGIMLRRSGEASQLACIADNISDALERGLRWMAEWMGEDPTKVKYRLSKDFYATRLSHQDSLALLAMWQGGLISQEVALDNLRAGEVVNELTSNEEVMGQIETEDPAPMLELETRVVDQGDEGLKQSAKAAEVAAQVTAVPKAPVSKGV